jgi:hypothetical protein
MINFARRFNIPFRTTLFAKPIKRHVYIASFNPNLAIAQIASTLVKAFAVNVFFTNDLKELKIIAYKLFFLPGKL